ncbi:MAG: glutamine amidotransferase [Candidatus Melainabacteria bacterium RIFCSPHIGHO2_02_FULL_34_12]|nr:MAG: glutamine amidotransferase [Candidatus Melainabacteria bacterium RIFCSPHIGHO2_02_FULL_34_12]
MILELAYLYPDLLNIYGDRGNVLTLSYRCQLRGINLNVTPIKITEKIDPEKVDVYFMGGGQDQQQIIVSEDLQSKKNDLISAIQNNVVFLAVCGGYQLLGKYYKAADGTELKGIEAVDLYTVAGDKRMIGNVMCEEIESGEELFGFENHSGKTYLGSSTKPFAKVIRGGGNNGEDGFEGVRYKNIFGTYLHGSFLPKNPYIADKIIRLALERKGIKMPEINIDDSLENLARKKAEKLRY